VIDHRGFLRMSGQVDATTLHPSGAALAREPTVPNGTNNHGVLSVLPG
jgi:hypothetical protein